MSPFFVLASDFVERMANPAYGIRVNEDHALRFATLLEREEVRSRLREEALELSSPDSLTPHGWLWLLTWARSRRVQLNEELLLDLADTWSSVFMQTLTIDVATIDVLDATGETTVHPSSLSNIEHPFLRRLLQRVTRIEEASAKSEQPPMQRAENTLLALLQIGRGVTLNAAVSLLSHHWGGQSSLLESYRALRAGLDDETRKIWDERLGVDFQKR
jgi:hypothetical protein